jgi:putative transposase
MRARRGRYFLPDQPLRVIQRGNNRAAILFRDEDYARHRDRLVEAAAEYGLIIHACVSITRHAHLLRRRAAAQGMAKKGQIRQAEDSLWSSGDGRNKAPAAVFVP